MSNRVLIREGQKSKRIRLFYEKAKLTSSVISKMKFDINKDIKWKEKLKSANISVDEYKSSVYNTFNIKQYSSKNEFVQDMQDYGYTDEQIGKMYKEYVHRDKLIESGQYQEYRIGSYQKKYINALEIANVDRVVIENIKKLSIGEFNKLVRFPNANNGNVSKYSLPILGGFNYQTLGVKNNEKIKEIEDSIKGTFKDVGINFDEDIMSEESIDFEPELTTYKSRRTIDRLTSHQSHKLRTDDENEYIINAYELLYDKIKHGSKIYKDYGSYSSLAFIGTSKPTSRNYQFVLGFRNWLKGKK